MKGDTMKMLMELSDRVAAYYKAERAEIATLDERTAMICFLSVDEAERADLATLASAARLADRFPEISEGGKS